MNRKLIVDGNQNLVVLFWIVFLSLVLGLCVTWFMDRLISFLPSSIQQFSFVIDIGSPLGIYALLLSLYNNYLWNTKFFRLLSHSKHPNLSGDWVGTLRSDYEESVEINVKVNIKQKWLSIDINFSSEKSTSMNKFGYIHRKGDHYVLSYEYNNTPNLEFRMSKEMQIHDGYAVMEVSEDCKSITGYYYTDYDRMTIGHFNLTKITTSFH